MNKKLEEFNNKLLESKVAVIGAGVSNVPLIKYLANLGCNVSLFDRKEYDNLSSDVIDCIEKYNISYELGNSYLERLIGFDIIFRSPSCLPNNKYLVEEEKRGAIITTEVEQVVNLCPCKVIGITGSKGKTTTTTIINELLTKMGYSVFLGGNIGIPLFDKISQMKNDDIVVLELSSFQLMNMGVSPSISIVNNITPDHLDIHGSYSEYIGAKKYIYLNQSNDDIVVLNSEDDIVCEFYKEAKGLVRYFGCDNDNSLYKVVDNYIVYDGKNIIDCNKLRLKGRHNYLNICAALTAIHDYINVSYDKVEEMLSLVNSVHHRLEFVREVNGVSWYNDSASTTPDKSLAGINAFSSNIVLIAGGYDKNISYEPLADAIVSKVSKLILFGDTKNKIYDCVMNKLKGIDYDLEIYVMDTLEEVVSVANKVSKSGDVVLFSPASASFDMFENAYQRGDLFKKLVNDLEV